MSNIIVTGVSDTNDGTGRMIVNFDFEYNDLTYKWQTCTPVINGDVLMSYLNNRKSSFETDVDAKEAYWLICPKTRWIEDIDGPREIPVTKDEIVCPDMPDYASKRIDEYPTIGDQLDAIWKGEPYFTEMKNRIIGIKNKHPKK